MDKFIVSTEHGVTVITATKHNLKLRVISADNANLSGNTAVIEATLYVEQGGFIPKCSYFFEMISDVGHLITDVDIDNFKAAVDFFFHSVLGTELFVKSIPQASSLCPAERKHYSFY